jgi:hypothetical protein
LYCWRFDRSAKKPFSCFVVTEHCHTNTISISGILSLAK